MAVQIVQYGSPYVDELNKLLLRFKEAGLDQHSRMQLNLALSSRRAGEPPTKSMAAVVAVRGLSLTNVSHAFWLYVGNLAISLITFLVELFWEPVSRRWRGSGN